MLPINLVLEEALSNVIFYAYEEGSSQEIHIEIEYVAPRLTITIKDTGKAFDPTQKEDPNLHLPVEERPIGGLGIFLMQKIMDEISYISCSGLRVFLTVQKKMMATGGKFLLFAMQPTIKEIFDISGFSSIFSIFDTEESALQHDHPFEE